MDIIDSNMSDKNQPILLLGTAGNVNVDSHIKTDSPVTSEGLNAESATVLVLQRPSAYFIEKFTHWVKKPGQHLLYKFVCSSAIPIK